MNKVILCLVLTGICFTSCKQNDSSNSTAQADSLAIKSINDSSFAKHIAVLASDDFQGRKPFTIGETKSINYLKEEFNKLGLKPGNGDSYFQQVPMVEIKSVPDSKMVFTGAAGSVTATYLENFVAGTRH